MQGRLHGSYQSLPAHTPTDDARDGGGGAKVSAQDDEIRSEILRSGVNLPSALLQDGPCTPSQSTPLTEGSDSRLGNDPARGDEGPKSSITVEVRSSEVRDRTGYLAKEPGEQTRTDNEDVGADGDMGIETTEMNGFQGVK